MKAKLLIIFVGIFLIGCSVEPIEDEFTNVDSRISEDHFGCAGPDNSLTITVSEAIAVPDRKAVKNLFLSMLGPDVPLDGTFDPTIKNIIDAFDSEGGGLTGDYSTIYTITGGDCTDTVELTLRIVPDQDLPVCDLDAGPDNSLTITLSEAIAVPDRRAVINLYLSMLGPDVPRDGTFDPTIKNIIDAFDSEGGGRIGDYPTIYTITDGDCTDTVELTLRIVPDQDLPVCDLDAGPDNSLTITLSEAIAVPDRRAVKNLYLSMLGPDVPRDGTFDPSIKNIIDAFDSESGGLIGDYPTIYTITDGDCTDTVELTLRIVPDQDLPVCDLDAGPDNYITLTVSEAIAVPDRRAVKNLYLSMLGPDVPRDGIFDPTIKNIIDAFDSEGGGIIGNYTTTYTITNGECSDSVELTIRVVAD